MLGNFSNPGLVSFTSVKGIAFLREQADDCASKVKGVLTQLDRIGEGFGGQLMFPIMPSVGSDTVAPTSPQPLEISLNALAIDIEKLHRLVNSLE